MNFVKKIITEFKKSVIARNVLSVSGGNLISQIIIIISIPIMARVYSATGFGFLSIFISYASILASLTTLKLELAISLPKSEEKASTVTILSILSSLVISLIYLLVIFLFYEELAIVMKLKAEILLLIPITTFAIALFASNQQLNMREGRFKYTSSIAVFLSVSNVAVAFILSFFLKDTGLILGYAISYFLSSIIITWPLFDRLKKQFNSEFFLNCIQTLKEYSSFPKVMVFTSFLTIASQQGIPIILSIFFTTSDIGYFSMANRVVMLPTIILGSAFSSVFRFHFSEINNQNLNLRPAFIKLLKRLILGGFPVFAFISVISPFIFPLVLGNEWRISGKYASVLSIVAFCHFLNLSISNIYIVFQKQFVFFLTQFILIVGILISAYAGHLYFDSLFIVISLISLSFVIFTVLNIYTAYKLTFYTNNSSD